jgi:hypothetical protein
MLLLFYTLLLFFLVLHIPLYYFFVDSNRTDKIASSPETIPPVRFWLQLRIALEQLYDQLAFQYPHQFRNRYLRLNRQNKMNVITLYAHFMNLTSLPFAQHLYIFFDQFLDFPGQDPKSVFRNPNKMVFTLIDNMRQFLVLSHVTNIGIAQRTLPPPREVGF